MRRHATSWQRALLAVALLLTPGALAWMPSDILPAREADVAPPTVDAIGVLEAALPALKRPYYAQLAGAPLDAWPRDYAWQLAALENPVLDPGFTLGGVGWTLEPGAAAEGGVLTLAPGARAVHDFRYVGGGPGEPPCSDEGCGGVSIAHMLATVSFLATGEGTVDVALREPGRGSSYTTTPVAFHEGVNRVRLSDFEPQRPPPVRGIEAAHPGRALLAALTFTSAEGATIDDVVVQARAGTPVADARGVDPATGPDVGGATPLDPAFGPLAPAHDGVSTLVFPMASLPTEPSFYALAIEHGPSGARVLAVDPDLSSLRSEAPGGVASPVESTAAPLATTASPFARLLAESGLVGEGVVLTTSTPSNAWSVSLVVAEDGVQIAAGEFVRGTLHLGKLADPGSPVADLLDVVPDAVAGAAGPALFQDADGDGYTDAFEGAAGSRPRDARDMPGRDPTLAGEIVANQVPARVHEIVYPLATMTGFLTPTEPLVVEIDSFQVGALADVRARLVPSFEPTGEIELDVEVLDPGSPPRLAPHWPGEVVRAWRIALSLPDGVALSEGSFGQLHDLEVSWSSGEDTQPRAVMLLQEFPERPLVAVLSDARLGDPLAAGNVSLMRAFDELALLRPDVVLFTGDLVANLEGYDAAYELLADLRAPILIAPGDHDTALPGIDGRFAWKRVFGPLHHATTYGDDVTFVALDTFDRPAAERATTSGGSVGDAQLAWLGSTLAAARGDTIVAFGHHSPSWPQEAPTLRDIAVTPNDPSEFWTTLVRAVGAYLPHPIDLAVPVAAAQGEAVLSARASGAVERWTGENRIELQEALAGNATVFFAGHLLEDRLARIEDGALVEVGAGSLPSGIEAFRAATAGPLYVDVPGIGADGREYRGYRLWDGSGAGLDGYDITSEGLAARAAQPGLWSAELAALGLYSVPVGGLSSTFNSSVGRIMSWNVTNDLDETVVITRNVSFADDPDAILAGRSVEVSRVATADGKRFADLTTTVAARTSASLPIFFDDAAPIARLVPLEGAATNVAAWTLTVDPASADELEGGLESIFVDQCDGATCFVAADGLAPGDEFDVTLPAEGTFTFHARGRDVAGHEEVRGEPEVTLRLDILPPTTIASLAGIVGRSGWYVGPVTLTLSCNALGGTPCTPRHRLDGEGWIPYASPVEFEAQVATLEVSAIDEAGNVEAPRAVEFRLDRVPPVTTIDLPEPAGANGWHVAPIALRGLARCADASSGCASTLARLDGDDWKRLDDVAISTSGAHVLEYASTDAAGNVEPTRTLTIPIDLTTPAISIAPTAPVVATLPTISGSATTGPSGGVALVAIDGGAPASRPLVEGAWSLDLAALALAEGTHSVVVRALDGAGRASAPATLSFLYDTAPPHVAIAASAGARNVPSIAIGFAFDVANPFRDARVGWRFAPLAGGEPGDWIDRGATTPGSFVLPLTAGDGRYDIVVRAADAAGRTGTSNAISIVLDTTAPTLARTSAGTALVTEGSTTLRFDAVDALPIASVRLDVARDDGQIFSGTSTSLAVPLLGSTRLLSYALRATDAAGNVATIVGEIRIIDPRAPTPLVVLEGPAGANGWFTGDVLARLSASAADAIVRARAYPEGAPAGELVPAKELSLRGTGRHVLEAQAIAERFGAALQSGVETRVVLIDEVPPSIAMGGPDGMIEGQRATVRASASDAGSGVASVVASIHHNGVTSELPLELRADGSWSATVGPFRLGDVVAFEARATDVAGHATTSAMRSIPIADATPPLVVLTAPATSRVSGIVTLSADAVDDGGIASLVFEIDGAPLEGAWDTRAATNGPHTILVRATDRQRNEATDALDVVVDNPPAAGPLTFSPTSDEEPTPLTEQIVATMPVTAARSVQVRLYHRIAGASAFTSAPMELAGGVARAAIAGPFAANTAIEAFAVVEDGASSTRAPASGVATLSVKLPPTAPLALWIDEAPTSFGAAASQELPAHEDYADIASAGVLADPEWITFAATTVGAIDTTGHARYYVDLHASATEAIPLASYELASDGAGVWTLRLQRAEASTVLPAADHRAIVETAEYRIRVRPSALVADLGGALPPALQVRFRTVGSGDLTSLAPLDLVAPTIELVEVLENARGAPVRLRIGTTDAQSSVTLRILATAAGIPVTEAIVLDGIATLPALAADQVDVAIVATDAAGNRAERPITIPLVDVVAPVARPALSSGGTSVDEDVAFTLVADASTDDVGIVAYLWDLDADGAADLQGRRVSSTFAEPGLRTVALTVRDAAGNAHRATLAMSVLDRTPPAVALLAPAEGAFVKAGAVAIRSAALGAATAGFRIDGGAWQPMAPTAPGVFAATWGATEGPHTILVSATDDAGNRGIAARAIPVVVDATAPVVDLRVPSAALPNARVELRALAFDANGIHAATWDLGDGQGPIAASLVGGESTIEPTFAEGNYDISFTAVDPAGHAVTQRARLVVAKAATPAPASRPTEIVMPPVPLVARIEGAASALAGEVVGLSAAPDALAPHASYVWDFGDGATASGREVEHAWTTAGTYAVRVHIRSGDREASALRLIVIREGARSDAPDPATGVGGSEADHDAPPASDAPRLPGVRAIVPEGVLPSPATVHFELDNAELVFWRLPGRPDWDSTNPAIVAADGPITIDYYALNAAGRSITHAITLHLDAFAPELQVIEAPRLAPPRAPFTLRFAIQDVSEVEAHAEIVPAQGGAPTLVPIRRAGEAYEATVPGLPEGEYTVTLVARDAAGRESRESFAISLGEQPIEETSVPAAVAEPAADVPAPGPFAALVALAIGALALRRRRS